MSDDWEDLNNKFNSTSNDEQQDPAGKSSRDVALDNIPDEKHIDVMRLANDHNITKDDPIWIMIDVLLTHKEMMSATREYMETARKIAIEESLLNVHETIDDAIKNGVIEMQKGALAGVQKSLAEPISTMVDRINKCMDERLAALDEATDQLQQTSAAVVGATKKSMADMRKTTIAQQGKVVQTSADAIEKLSSMVHRDSLKEVITKAIFNLLLAGTAGMLGGFAFHYILTKT